MRGELIIARSLTASRIKDSHGNFWQYHPRSDRHSKIACWCVLFDLLRVCTLLRDQVSAGKVAFGINHVMRDFKQDRKKVLDLVLCHSVTPSALTFRDYADDCGIVLDPQEAAMLASLPNLPKASPSNVLLAMEAKACMTEHVKALPRLHDELSSSHQTIHGDTSSAIAAGFVMINCSDTFISPDRNRKRIRPSHAAVSRHRQPEVARRTLDAVMKLPRRSGPDDIGFDAIGVTMVRCSNDRQPVTVDLVENAAMPEILGYDAFVRRLAHLYSTKFMAI